ncbi:MAG: hypothetical protein ACI808_003028 [Paraglaciecola sp.]
MSATLYLFAVDSFIGLLTQNEEATMIEYKIKASMLVFSLLVTLTGSIITVEDWAQLNVEQQIAIVEKNFDLGDAEEELLVDMLKSRDDPQKLEKTFLKKARELRLEADATSSPIKRFKYRDAAEAFYGSLMEV